MTVALASDARARVDRIKVGVEAVWHLIVESYQSRDWEALGYATWDEMCTREFGTSRLRLPREERAETIGSLRDAGLSLRAIAAATGTSRPTIIKELRSREVVNPLPPDPEPTPANVNPETGEITDADQWPDDDELTEADCEALASEPEPEPEPAKPITGLDGKQYRPTTPRGPQRKAITDEFRGASLDLGRAVDRVTRLTSDDRFKRNADQISQSYLHDLIRARDALQRVIDQLPQGV